MLGMFGIPILLLLLTVLGLYIYDQKKTNESASAADQAISDCVRDYTRVAASSEAQGKATSDCVREITPEAQH